MFATFLENLIVVLKALFPKMTRATETRHSQSGIVELLVPKSKQCACCCIIIHQHLPILPNNKKNTVSGIYTGNKQKNNSGLDLSKRSIT